MTFDYLILLPTRLLLLAFLSVPAWAAPFPDAKPVYQPKPGPAQIAALVQRVKGEMVFFPGGTFQMGDWGDPKSGLPWDYNQDSKPLHPVTLDAFSMMRYKVTYPDFDLFTAANHLPQVDMTEFVRTYRGPQKPAGVSWYGARAYCQWLGKLTGLPFGLPTEAQWEYAARSGGKEVLFSTDNGEIDPGRNYPVDWPQTPESEDDSLPDVGRYPPNPAGLYAMAVKSREWVQDWYDPSYYAHAPEHNPKGPATGTKKVQRGDLGSPPEMSTLTFVRAAAPPRRMDSRLTDSFKYVDVPYIGYSSLPDDTFRCVVNAPQPVR